MSVTSRQQHTYYSIRRYSIQLHNITLDSVHHIAAVMNNTLNVFEQDVELLFVCKTVVTMYCTLLSIVVSRVVTEPN